MNNLGIIIRREYVERVSKKSFIITTILVPVLMACLMVLPSLLMLFHESDTYTYAVVDNSNMIATQLNDSESVKFIRADVPFDSIKADDNYAGVLVIGSDIISNPSIVQLYNHGAGSIDTEIAISSQLEDIIENERLKAYDIENFKEIMKEVEANVNISTYRLDKGEESSSVSSIISFVIGLAMSFMLYMFLLIYGQMVMTSIIEEKNNRVLEIIVSSVRPEQLMLGKIIGIGLVAITQIVIWGVIIATLVSALLPAIMPAEILNDVNAFNAGNFDAALTANDPDLIKTISILGDLGYILKLFIYMTLFLIGGFLLYASVYAAIGSAVDNVQDAQQLQTVAMAPIMIALVFETLIGSDPNTSLAFWLSVIPFTSPMIMMVRVPFDIPGWEVWLSLAILYASFLAMVWIAAKIYRVGIFMYGKKPTFAELIKWINYK